MLARLSNQVTLHVSGQGKSTINLNDGHAVLTSYVGPEELRVALEQDKVQPLSLAAADFDEDGVPDLISGYGYQGRGVVTVLRGNIDSIYPNAPEAQARRANGTLTDAPFLSPARVFEAPSPVDFVGAGDFDGDGHWDVVTASRAINTLYLFSGDGHGGLVAPKEVLLPGPVTAITTGEINRRDDLTDVIVGVDGSDGPKVMVFEGPDGALRAEPEILPMPATVTSLALGQLDDEYTFDLAVAAGAQLIIVHGRDRKLSEGREQQAAVPLAKTDVRSFSATIKSVVIGDFNGQQHSDIALLTADGAVRLMSQGNASSHKRNAGQRLERGGVAKWPSEVLPFDRWPKATELVSARVSGLPTDDLVVLDSNNRQLQILTRRRAKTSDATGESLSKTGEAQHEFLTLNVEDGGPVAVLPMRLNKDALSDLVILNREQVAPTAVESAAATTFVVTSAADTDGSICAAICTLRQAINAANANPGADTITFAIGSGVKTISHTSSLPTITDPVTIDGTTQPGFTGTPLIELRGNNLADGLTIWAGSSVVRGLVINVAVNLVALGFQGGNIIEGNFIGTDVTGTKAPGSGGISGVAINDSSNTNTIGGTTANARNLISPIGANCVSIADSSGNMVQGNLIGTDVTGTAALGTKFTPIGTGVSMQTRARNNLIGGTTVGTRNLISGTKGPQGQESCGICMNSAGNGNLVQANFIGIDINGTSALGNSVGVSIRGTNNSTVGGTGRRARNFISGNRDNGIEISSAVNLTVTGNRVQGNYIGTDVTGTRPLGNGGTGVLITQAANTLVGGADVGARNIISANLQHGVGIGLLTRNNDIGGTGARVQGNYIGTDLTGNGCLGNNQDGVFVEVESFIHAIVGNVIACNGGNGLNIPNFAGNPGTPGVRINIDGNGIYKNALLGINLGEPGITSNDPLDTDTGANLQQNFPVLTSVTLPPPTSEEGMGKPNRAEVTVNINATLNSTPNTTFTVHWYFSTDSQCSNNQTASQPLAFGRIPGVTTGNDGNASFSFPFDFPPATSSGVINSTATDPQGNTSEFSSCFPVSPIATPPTLMQFSAPGYSVGENEGSATVTVTRSGNTLGASAVDFATTDGTAQQETDYITAAGTLSFGPGETSKTFEVLITDDVYKESNETVSVNLSNPVGANISGPATVILTIADNDTTPPVTNPLDDARFFVKQHYYDFLNRFPDQGGWDYWTGQITQCTDQTCLRNKRVDVSNAFFYELEYQQTGSYVYRLYRTAYGNNQPFPNSNSDSNFPGEQLKLPSYAVFAKDRARLVGGAGLAQSQINLASSFVQRAEFVTKYPATLSTGEQFVDAVLATIKNDIGVNLTSQRTTLLDLFNSGGRAAVIYRLADDNAQNNPVDNRALIDAEYNRAFVATQYFGYLRRDADIGGFLFWLGQVSSAALRDVPKQHAMVCAFITADEYQHRFSPIATHTNSECPQ